jgi:hypothetical protein
VAKVVKLPGLRGGGTRMGSSLIVAGSGALIVASTKTSRLHEWCSTTKGAAGAIWDKRTLACAVGFLLYTTRAVTKGPLEVVVSRLEESPNHLFAMLGAVAVAIGKVLKAIVDYGKAAAGH